MQVAEFIAKWSKSDLPERAASQEHFLDLCALLGQPTPAGHDATGSEYAFEKGIAVAGPASAGSVHARDPRGAWGGKTKRFPERGPLLGRSRNTSHGKARPCRLFP